MYDIYHIYLDLILNNIESVLKVHVTYGNKKTRPEGSYTQDGNK